MGTKKDAASFQHAVIGIDEVPKSYTRTDHPDAQWFPEAGLGMFLHWGLSSVDGNMDLSWGMMAYTPYDGNLFNGNKMKPTEYWKLAERFNPEHYDPRKWLAAAKAAGIRYVVLTTRHHEGFALWPSAFGDFNRIPITGACRSSPSAPAAIQHSVRAPGPDSTHRASPGERV